MMVIFQSDDHKDREKCEEQKDRGKDHKDRDNRSKSMSLTGVHASTEFQTCPLGAIFGGPSGGARQRVELEEFRQGDVAAVIPRTSWH